MTRTTPLPTTPTTRARIFTLHTLPKSPRKVKDIAKEFDRPVSTIYDIISRFKTRRHHFDKDRTGRPLNTFRRDRQHVMSNVRSRPVGTWEEAAVDHNPSTYTIRRLAADNGYRSYIASSKGLFTHPPVFVCSSGNPTVFLFVRSFGIWIMDKPPFPTHPIALQTGYAVLQGQVLRPTTPTDSSSLPSLKSLLTSEVPRA